MLQNLRFCSLFDKVHNPLHLPRETTSEPPKVVQPPRAFNILNSKCASRHNTVHFFNIATSKSGPNMWCFVHFDFEMCFAPQRRTLFHIATSKSGPNMWCFEKNWLGNVLRATTACNFLISHLARWLRTPLGRFSEPTFRPSRSPKSLEKHGKTQFFSTCLPFRAFSIFFLLTLSLLWSSLFYSSLLSDSFPSLLFICPYCRKFDF